MSQHLNVYSQKGCIGCKSCEGGAGSVGRTATMVAIVMFTGGLGLLILPFYRKCQFCGHSSWMNKHTGPQPQQAPAPYYPPMQAAPYPSTQTSGNGGIQ